MSHARARRALRLLVLAAVYFIAGRLGLSLAVVHASATPVWPPTGLALGAVLLFGTGVWPAIAAGAFLVNVTTSGSFPVSLAIAAGNTLEALAGAWLVRRYADGSAAFNRVDTTFRFAALGGAVAPVIAASIGAATLRLAGLARAEDLFPIWGTWWLGDACGAVIVTPLMVLWLQRDRFNTLTRRPLEALALAAALSVVSLVVFWNLTPLGREQRPAAFITTPPLLWAAFRFGPRGAATCSAILSAVALVGTLNGYGPFAGMALNDGLLTVQSFVATMTMTALACAGESQQRRAREAELVELNADLERALGREQAARRESEDANRLKDEFLAMLSHELRTPLNAVMGWAQMLLRGVVDDERRTRALELIYRNAAVQAQMISDLLDLSRVTSRTLTLKVGRIDFPAVVEAAVEAVRPAALDKRVDIHVDLDETLWVNGDAKRLAQVAGNLLVNAVKFTPAGGRVDVRLERRGDLAELSIEDTGTGIDEEFLPHVFDRFRQGDASVTREHGGLGLGLAIARHIVELHGGSISARNRSDVRGSAFTVALPAPVAA